MKASMILFPGYVVAIFLLAGPSFASDTPTAVPTFHCLGIYWTPEDGGPDNTCRVRYRKASDTEWSLALPPVYDMRKTSPVGSSGRGPDTAAEWQYYRQYRGSIVNLTPGTEYEVELLLEKTGTKRSLKATTWSEHFPVGKTVEVGSASDTLKITEGGDENGYVLYTSAKSKDPPVIDVSDNSDYCVEIRASHVILRGLTLKNARIHGIRIFDGCRDIVIEDCDISGWGRIADDGWGQNLDSALYSNSSDCRRVVVQRNRIHHPRGDSSNWRELRPRPGKREPYHSEGPQAVYFSNSCGNHVIRYNTVFSDDDHQYNDIFGAGSNFSTKGFPNCDSDIYGNALSHCWDDAIESEGANCNVRIWGNYMTECFVGVATAGTSVGPLYVFRNVTDRMRVAPGDFSGGFLKSSDIMGGGRIYVFHNTVLQPYEYTKDGRMTVGASVGLGWGGPLVNVVTRNNILNVKYQAFRDKNNDPSNDYDYDLYRGELPTGRTHQQHGIAGAPSYDLGNKKGQFALTPDSPGYDAGLRIPNFNDDFTGRSPDFGAHEANTPPMIFGVRDP